MIPSAPGEAWFATGSQGRAGKETLHQVASQSQAIAAALDAAPDIPVRVAAYYRLARGS
jgi:L-arabinose isomerase